MTLEYKQFSNKSEIFNSFYNSLIEANLEKAINLSKEFIKSDNDIVYFWEKVILPSLYKIGKEWEDENITVGEEHVATSICQRVMSEHYSKILKHIKKRKNILVTTGSFELHEVGARMLSDILELKAYDVTFLSSTSSFEEIMKSIYDEDIDFIIISSTIISNIPKVFDLSKKIKESYVGEKMPIIILGGQAFFRDKSSQKTDYADYYIKNVDDLLSLLKRYECAKIK